MWPCPWLEFALAAVGGFLLVLAVQGFGHAKEGLVAVAVVVAVWCTFVICGIHSSPAIFSVVLQVLIVITPLFLASCLPCTVSQQHIGNKALLLCFPWLRTLNLTDCAQQNSEAKGGGSVERERERARVCLRVSVCPCLCPCVIW